jgi:hypothetical protein
MGVTEIVTGHYFRAGTQLQVTLEAVNVESNRSVWRDTVNVAASDLIGMHDMITTKVRRGLLPLFGASLASTQKDNRPRNPEAYDLYLRSVGASHDWRFHDLETAMAGWIYPACVVSHAIWQHSTGTPKPLANKLSVTMLKSFDDHEEHGRSVAEHSPTDFRAPRTGDTVRYLPCFVIPTQNAAQSCSTLLPGED